MKSTQRLINTANLFSGLDSRQRPANQSTKQKVNGLCMHIGIQYSSLPKGAFSTQTWGCRFAKHAKIQYTT